MAKQDDRASAKGDGFGPEDRRMRIIALCKSAHGIGWELSKHLYIIKRDKLFKTKAYGEHESFDSWLKTDDAIKLAPSTCSELSMAYSAAIQWSESYKFDRVESSWPEPSLVTSLRKAEGKCAPKDFEVLVREIFEPEDGNRLTRQELNEIIKKAVSGEIEEQDEDERNNDQDNETEDDEESDEEDGESDEEDETDSGKTVKSRAKRPTIKASIRKKKGARKSGKTEKDLLEIFRSATESLKRVSQYLSKIDGTRLAEGHHAESKYRNFRGKLRSAFQGWAFYFLNVQDRSEKIGNEFAIWYGYDSDMPDDFASGHDRGYKPLIAEPKNPMKS